MVIGLCLGYKPLRYSRIKSCGECTRYAVMWKQQKAKELRQQGWSYPRIARVLGIAESTVRFWQDNAGAQFCAPENSYNSPTTVIGKQYPATKPKKINPKTLQGFPPS